MSTACEQNEWAAPRRRKSRSSQFVKNDHRRGAFANMEQSAAIAHTDEAARIRTDLLRLLRQNTRDGYSRLLRRHYCYVAPAPGTYPFQWFWDTCFHVLMLVQLGEIDLAKRNLASLFAMQEEDGFVGHMIFWNQVLPSRRTDVLQAKPSWRALRPHMSALIQPPFVAQALHAVVGAVHEPAYFGEMYAKIKRYHEWLARERDFDGDGLLTIISPFESGMDWKPSYDPIAGHASRTTERRLFFSKLYWCIVDIDLHNFMLRYDLARIKQRRRFLVKDVGLNTAYALDLRAMEYLARKIGDDPSPYAARRQRLVTSMLRLMYDEDARAFLDLHEPGSQRLPILTSTIFFPLVLEEVPQGIVHDVIAAHWDREDGFRAGWQLPTVERRDPSFFPGETPFLWRGPVWPYVNWFLYRGLKARGLQKRADALRLSLMRLIERSGFREYYDPLTGEGHGAEQFTWAGLFLDMY